MYLMNSKGSGLKWLNFSLSESPGNLAITRFKHFTQGNVCIVVHIYRIFTFISIMTTFLL